MKEIRGIPKPIDQNKEKSFSDESFDDFEQIANYDEMKANLAIGYLAQKGIKAILNKVRGSNWGILKSMHTGIQNAYPPGVGYCLFVKKKDASLAKKALKEFEKM